MSYEWEFMNAGAKKVRDAGLSVALYEKALNCPERGEGVWQRGDAGWSPASVAEACAAIRALAASLDWSAASGTITDLADWIEGRSAE